MQDIFKQCTHWSWYLPAHTPTQKIPAPQAQTQNEAQRSGFVLERRNDGMSELFRLRESEWYEIRSDDVSRETSVSRTSYTSLPPKRRKLTHSVAPPLQIATASLGCNLVYTAHSTEFPTFPRPWCRGLSFKIRAFPQGKNHKTSWKAQLPLL